MNKMEKNIDELENRRKHCRHHRNCRRKFHEMYRNEIIMLTIVSAILFFGFLWMIIVHTKVKNFEKKGRK